MHRAVTVSLLALVLTACSSPKPATTPRSSPVPTATPTATLVPDIHQVDITATGVGAYNLVAVPVAVLHSQATRGLATGVVVHFTTSRAARPLFSLDSEAVELFPGQTLVVTANCTDTCEAADSATATVSVDAWTAVNGAPIVVDPAVYACGGSCRGHGYGDVTALIHGAGLRVGLRLHLFADCTAADGAIVGGGQRAVIWPAAGVDERLAVPVILSAQPTTCTVSASPASSTVADSPRPAVTAAPSTPGSGPGGSPVPSTKPTVPAG